MVDRERFVPLRVGTITSKLCDAPWSDGDDAELFRSFSRLTAALFHYQLYDREQAIIEAWEAADSTTEGTAGSTAAAAARVTTELSWLLERANYSPLTMSELDDALDRESMIPLRMEVDLDDYDEVLIHRRGSHRDTIEVKRWKGLRSEELTITVDERVIVYARVKPRSWFEAKGIDPAERNLVPGRLSLKQFQNVPRADIEMLLPSTQVKLRRIDSLVVGVPAVISGVIVLATKLLPTLGLVFVLAAAWLGLREQRPVLDQTALVVLLGGAITLGGFLFRQWSKLKNRRVEYLKTLTENLYFRTLADGPGVIHTLLSSAEQQDVLEVLLAYRFLVAAPGGLTRSELDGRVETWLRDSCDCDLDFEIDDSLAKLNDLDLVDGDATVVARPLAESLELLDRRWDDLFHHPRAGSEVG